jgi:hypothetical protein
MINPFESNGFVTGREKQREKQYNAKEERTRKKAEGKQIFMYQIMQSSPQS